MDKIKIRKPVVAGQFYPAYSEEIKQQLSGFVDKATEKTRVIACMLPHAGYMYSGQVAAITVSRIEIRDKIILLGPNHTGYGSPYSIMDEGIWQTPLGNVSIDIDLAKQLLNRSRYLESDILAHRQEHSLEVELPILQYFRTDFKIVPITVMSGGLSELKEIGKEIASTIKEYKIQDSTMIIASSDMTHYEPQSKAEKKDNAAIQAILELDEDKLMERIGRLDISMCGYAPTIIMLTAAKLLGAQKTELIKYQTSAEATGDKSSVVGYAGIIIS